MVKFEELENQICQSKKKDYSFTNDGQGKKTYTIFSEELKNSLRNTINPTLWEEWQVRFPTQKNNFYEYRKEQEGKFVLYKKTEAENSPDEFVVLCENQNSVEKKDFKETNQRIEEAERRMDEASKRIEGKNKKNEEHEKSFGKNSDYISFSTTWNKDGEIIEKKIEQPADPAKRQEIEDSWGFRAIGEAFSILNRKDSGETSSQSTQNNQSQQQAQIRQENDPKFLFWQQGEKKS